jgi:hypothetical protein
MPAHHSHERCTDRFPRDPPFSPQLQFNSLRTSSEALPDCKICRAGERALLLGAQPLLQDLSQVERQTGQRDGQCNYAYWHATGQPSRVSHAQPVQGLAHCSKKHASGCGDQPKVAFLIAAAVLVTSSQQVSCMIGDWCLIMQAPGSVEMHTDNPPKTYMCHQSPAGYRVLLITLNPHLPVI